MALNALLVVIMLGAVAEAFCSLGAASVAGGVDGALVTAMLRRRAAFVGTLSAALIFRLAV